jgi:hypothetical protein
MRVYSPSAAERIEYIHLRSKHTGIYLHTVEVVHYETIMARLLEFQNDGYEVVYLSTGKGSVSDQQMMNVMFEELRIPLYYSRRAGNFGYIERELAHG